MISDGKRSLRRAAPNKPGKPLPLNLSEMMNASHKSFDEEQLKEEHAHLQPAGEEPVNGVAARVYQMSSDSGPSKIWIAADTSRILKVERDYEGAVPTSRPKMGAKGGMDFKGATGATQSRGRATSSPFREQLRLRSVDQDHDARELKWATRQRTKLSSPRRRPIMIERLPLRSRRTQARQFSATQDR